MAVLSKLKDGQLLLAGEVNERMPVVQDSLVAHFPFDNSIKGIGFQNMYNYGQWGSDIDNLVGHVGEWSDYDSAEGNTRVREINPFEKEIWMWQASTNSGSAYASAGGIYHYAVAIDNTKTYRFSFWERRTTNNGATYGRYYFGCNGYGSVNGVLNITNDAYNTNPYFFNCNHNNWILETNEWFLIVGFIHPVGYAETTPCADSGIYQNGVKVASISTEFKFAPETTTLRSRTLSIYRGDVEGMLHHTCYPRMDLCDGTEPTIEDLLNGEGNTINPTANTNTTLTYQGIGIEEATTNMISYGDFSNWTSTANSGTYPIVYSKVISAPVGTENAHKVWIPDDGTYPRIRLLWTPTNTNTHTFSVYLKSAMSDECRVQIGIFRTSPWNLTSNGIETFTLTKNWERYTFSFQPLDTTEHRFYIGSHDTAKGMLWYIWGAQCEEKSFATSFINGSRNDYGNLSLPEEIINFNEGTFACQFKPSGGFFSEGSWNRVIGHSTSMNCNEIQILRNSTNSNLAFAISNASGSPQTTWSNCLSSNLTANQWYNLVARWSITDEKMSLTVNDTKVESTLTSGYLPTVYGTLAVGYHPNASNRNANSIIKNVSIYDRALSDLEAEMLFNSVSQNENGLITHEIKEGPIIPDDVIFIDLGSEASNNIPVQESKTELNTVYENGKVWIGEGTTNEYSSPTFDSAISTGGWNHWGATGAIGTYGQNTDKQYIFDKSENYSHWVNNDSSATGNYLLYQSPATEATDRSVQVIICMSDFSEVTQSKVYPAWNAGSGTPSSGNWTSIEKIGDSYFYLCKTESLYQDGTNDLLGFYVTPGNKVYFSRAQLEKKKWCSPFTKTTRGDAYLYYYIPQYLASDKDWMVGVFAKLPPEKFAVGSGRVAIISVGDYYDPNESDASIAHGWGAGSDDDGELAIIGYNNLVGEFRSGTTLTSTEYSDWILYILQYDASADTLYAKIQTNSGLKTLSKSRTMAGLVSRLFLGGYDWDKDNGDGFYKNLLLSHNMLTDSEISSIYNIAYTQNNDSVNVKEFFEGETL